MGGLSAQQSSSSCALTHRKLASFPYPRPLIIEDRVTLDEVKAALARGRHVVLVTPPAPEQAGELWELLAPPPPDAESGAAASAARAAPAALIICSDDVSAAEWVAAAPDSVRVHAVTGLARTARLLKVGSISLLAGAVKDLAALVARSALKLGAVSTVVLAWPEQFAAGEHGAALDTLLGETREAHRIVLSWNPAALGDFLERHARRALVVGTAPVDVTGRPLPPVAPARYAIVAPSRRAAALRDALDALDPKHPFVWEGGPLDAPAETPDTVLCLRLPTRQQFAALARLAEPVAFVTAAQLPYLRSLAAPLTLLRLPGETDRARDRAEALRAQVAAVLEAGAVDAELALLDPLFDHFDPAEVAAALLALRRETGNEKRETGPPEPAAAWVRVFVNVGRKDRAAAKDLVGALIREVGLGKGDIGRIDLRDSFTLVDVADRAADRVVRGLTGVTIKGRRAVARLDNTGGSRRP